MIDNKRHYFLVGIIGILALMALAVVFYRERVAFSDMAYQLVYLILERKPFFMPIRIGAALPQFITQCAIWAHFDLKTVMIFQSLSGLILYLGLYCLAFKFSKRGVVFFCIPLTMVMLVNEVFYWPIPEVQQGLIWLSLYAVLLFEGRWGTPKSWRGAGLHFIYIFWLLSLHPLLFFPTAFLVLYYYGTVSRLFSREALYHMGACFSAFLLRSVAATFNTYEAGKFNIGSALRNNLPHFFSLDSVHCFFTRAHSDYLIYILFFIGAVIWLILNKAPVRSALLLLGSLGYWMLVMISSAQDARFYTESMLLPLGFMVSLPVLVDIVPALKSRAAPIFFLVVIAIRLGFIYHAHQDYTDRFAVYGPYFSYAQKHALNGVFVNDTLLDQKKAMVTWSSGYESVLISSLASPDSCTVVQAVPDANQYSWAADADTSLVAIYNVCGKSRLPERYFRLRGGKYEMITRRQ